MAKHLQKTMVGVFLPGNSTVELRTHPVPVPGPGQLLVQVKASGLCGSDIGYIYHEYKTHKGLNGAPAYRGVIAGHEPCGTVVEAGSSTTRFAPGDDVIVYHIHGCGVCRNCRAGYYISCSNQEERAAYGWQRDGGHAEYVLVDETECIPLPAPLTHADGALIACGFGTAYEGLRRAQVSGEDEVLIVGLGPVGLAAAMISRLLGARNVVGVERSEERIAAVKDLDLFDNIIVANEETETRGLALTEGRGFSVAVDCSGSVHGRKTALDLASEWGRVSLLGEGGTLETEVSDTLLHKQLTINASWVTSLQGMEDLAHMLASAGLHPEVIVTDRFPLSDAAGAFALAASGTAGKVLFTP